MKTSTTPRTDEQRSDLAYSLMTEKADVMELKFGERTNVETKKEGRVNFSYEVMFCDDNDKITTRIINVTIKGL